MSLLQQFLHSHLTFRAHRRETEKLTATGNAQQLLPDQVISFLTLALLTAGL